MFPLFRGSGKVLYYIYIETSNCVPLRRQLLNCRHSLPTGGLLFTVSSSTAGTPRPPVSPLRRQLLNCRHSLPTGGLLFAVSSSTAGTPHPPVSPLHRQLLNCRYSLTTSISSSSATSPLPIRIEHWCFTGNLLLSVQMFLLNLLA